MSRSSLRAWRAHTRWYPSAMMSGFPTTRSTGESLPEHRSNRRAPVVECSEVDLVERIGRIVVPEALDVSQVGAHTDMSGKKPGDPTAKVDAEVIVGD